MLLRRERYGELLMERDDKKDQKKPASIHMALPALLYSSMRDVTRVFMRLSKVIAPLIAKSGDYAGKMT